MAKYLSGIYASTYTLTTNPTTVTSAGLIDVNSTTAGAAGLLGTAGVAWTVANLGTVEAAGGTTGMGILLQGGGSVINGASGSAAGLISGNLDGVFITGAAGTVTNYGAISATGAIPTTFFGAGVIMFNGGSVKNLGTISANGTTDVGVHFLSGGSVTNGESGSTAGLIIGYNHGVSVNVSGGTIVNYGTIVGLGKNSNGVNLSTGGKLTNFGSISSTTTGTYGNGVFVNGAAGSITNFGTISAAGIKGVGVHLNAAGELTNYGTISATNGTGVLLNAGGSVTNGKSGSSGGLIQGVNGVGLSIAGSAGTVVNFGTVETALSANGGAIFLQVGGLVTNYGMITASNSISTPGTPGIAVVLVHGAAESGTVINFGTISAAPTNAHGVNLDTGGVLINGTTGLTAALITSAYNAVYVGGTFGTAGTGHLGLVYNYGTIENSSTAQAGVQLVSGGSVTNRGLISSARTGISFNNTAGTVNNFGTVVSTAPTSFTAGFGIILNAGGLVTNEAGASIAALRNAIQLGGTTSAAVTVFNSGDITGSVGISINAADTGNNTIINFGTITGTGTAGLAINLGAGDDQIVIESGSSLIGAVGNFRPGDTIDLPFLTFDANDSATLVGNGAVSNQLQVVGTAGTLFTVDLDPNQSFAGDIFQLSTDSGTGTLITEQAVCFCRGTLILTERGEVAVEDLAVGDRVQTLSGAFKPIRWIGFGRDLVTRANKLARPVIVRAGALADDGPRRDLYLTHGHSLYIDGVLIPVEHLVNHRSILWDDEARVVEYYHIELADHDVVFAEGAPAESYYDAGNRALFHNARAGSAAGAWKPTFAPVLNDGDIVGRVWADLYERAGGQIERDTSDDPDLHLIFDGERLDPVSVADGVYTFALAAPPAGPLRLRSRSAVPSLTGISRHDHRRLGVAIRQIILFRPGVMTSFDCDAPLFREGGCHPPENGYCWTDGDFELPARFFTLLNGAFTLLVHTKRHNTRYPIAAPVAQAA